MVGEVMSMPKCVHAGVSLTEATRILRGDGTRVVVIIDDTRRPLGVMTPDKLVEVVGQHARESLTELRPLDVSLQHTVVMPDTTRIDMAAHVLARTQRDFALVTSPAGRVEGVVFAGDLLRALGW
jgi:CBS domain-containing protein